MTVAEKLASGLTRCAGAKIDGAHEYLLKN